MKNLKRIPLLIFLSILFLVSGCRKPSSRWHLEEISDSNTTYNGSYRNAIKALKVRSHAWKIIEDVQKEDQVEWGFKVEIEFPESEEYKVNLTRVRLIMPINEIMYTLFDKDGFELTQLHVTEPTYVKVGETKTIQHTGRTENRKAIRAHHGRINLSMGYKEQKFEK